MNRLSLALTCLGFYTVTQRYSPLLNVTHRYTPLIQRYSLLFQRNYTGYRNVLRPVPGTAPELFGSCTTKKNFYRVRFFFQIKIFCHFQEKFAIWPKVQMANDTFQHDIRSINRVEKHNF